tara:strand:+ start:600 stop:794 length:195 start_codon:yes stop_codon:yes gene_type:complete
MKMLVNKHLFNKTGKLLDLERINREHDQQFNKGEQRAWLGKSNSVYDTERRDSLGTAWKKRYNK